MFSEELNYLEMLMNWDCNDVELKLVWGGETDEMTDDKVKNAK